MMIPQIPLDNHTTFSRWKIEWEKQFLAWWVFCLVGWLVFFFFFFCLFRAAPVAYGSSQVSGQIRAASAGLHHSHGNARSKPSL